MTTLLHKRTMESQKIIARGPEELSRSDRIIGVNPRVERGPGKEKWPKLCQMLLYSQGWRAGHWTEQSGIKKKLTRTVMVEWWIYSLFRVELGEKKKMVKSTVQCHQVCGQKIQAKTEMTSWNEI